MLSEEEKKEIIEDAGSASRRRAFAFLRESNRGQTRSLDDYIQFLKSVQTLFPAQPSIRKKTLTHLNRL